MDDLAQKRADVEKMAAAMAFEESDMGKTLISWYNGEISQLTKRLVEDDELDADNAKRAYVRGQLQAYMLLSKKLRLTKSKGAAAQRVLDANEPDQPSIPSEEAIENATS